MRTTILGILLLLTSAAWSQRECVTANYLEQQKLQQPALRGILDNVELFISQHSSSSQKILGGGSRTVVRIPVVVHVLYNTAEQNIPEIRITEQMEVLNRDFRMLNADTAAIPERFRPFAADTEIEFYLATADPEGRPTTGVIRKFTPVTSFTTDDRIKYTEHGGHNAWDSRYYLNIWVGNTRTILGYSTVPGAAAERDGIVVNYTVFGKTGGIYGLGRTAVHEAGHWLGLKHLWGDTYCGDDLVGDTPVQGNFTTGCPTGFRTSCNNGALGDMYMNYMDYTNDACLNMFTEGQRERMHALFLPGGPRHMLLSSKGLSEPWMPALTEPSVVEPLVRCYPNPATTEITIQAPTDLLGNMVTVYDANGHVAARFQLVSTSQKISLAGLLPGVYFIQASNGKQVFRSKFSRL
ncbi:MAG TPA: T9SS type A sorting domain-containing protein [Flavisolibacter sp.]